MNCCTQLRCLLRVELCAFAAIFISASLSWAQDAPPTTTPQDQSSGHPDIMGDEDKEILINGVFPGDKWSFYSGKKGAKLEETWQVKSDAEVGSYIACTGQPYGYIRTQQAYENFEFGLEWRFPNDANGNSGVLLFTSGDDRIWPKAIQVQLHQPVAGRIFPTQGAKSKNRLDNVAMVSRGVNQWNTCLIRCQSGTVTVRINDVDLGEVVECDPKSGTIALQSEGSEVHFRRIWIRELKADSEPTLSRRGVLRDPGRKNSVSARQWRRGSRRISRAFSN